MRICCVADLHGFLPEIPDCDLLLVAGDIVPTTAHTMPRSRRWLNTEFRRWLEELNRRGVQVVGVAGNHDFVFQSGDGEFVSPLQWTYLEDEEHRIRHRGRDILIYGSPWQPNFNNWAFNLSEDELAEKWAAIPSGLDILLLHGPPFGHGDLAPAYGPWPARHVGSTTLAAAIIDKKPRLVVAGHIHDARGVYRLNDSMVVNCSHVDENYRPVNSPILVELLDDGLGGPSPEPKGSGRLFGPPEGGRPGPR